MHARLETQRKQVQMSVPRQRLRQRGNQFRGTCSAAYGPRQSRTGARWTDHRRHLAALSVAERATDAFQRSGSIFASIGSIAPEHIAAAVAPASAINYEGFHG